MATKTWKIGECCQGGVLTATVTKKTITVIGKDWDESQGWSRNSDQSKAKEFTRMTLAIDSNYHNSLYEFLSELTTHYYASEVLDWIKGNVKVLPMSQW